MQLKDAREILGLGPDEDPKSQLAGLREAREHLAALVRCAPNEPLALRYQIALQEFDRALAAVREEVESIGDVTVAGADLSARGGKALCFWMLLSLVVLAAGGAAAWYVPNQTAHLERMRNERIGFLGRQGAIYIENRRWDAAARSFAEIEMLAPGSDVAGNGRMEICKGIEDEQTQFIGYWTGQAQAELEAGRFDESERAARRVLQRFPNETEAAGVLEQVAAARARHVLEAKLELARRALSDERWKDAIEAAHRVMGSQPDHREAESIIAEANARLAKMAADRERARGLFEQAVALDRGEFNLQALELLREAVALAPDDRQIQAQLEKMASYTRTIRVPGDFATPAEALAVARDRDRVVMAEQMWKGPLVINAAIELQGGGSGRTVVECAAETASALVIGPEAKGARVTGITFRHEAFQASGDARFSAVLVRGGNAVFSDCDFANAAGHGLAVIERGGAVVSRCRFSDNGWNGASVRGEGSSLEVRESVAINNIDHGIESWDGASLTLVNNRCEANCRNGIHADNQLAGTRIVGNQLIGNREFGLVLASAGSGKITDNTVRGNLLGGVVIRAAAGVVTVAGNVINANSGPGLVLEKGLDQAAFGGNRMEGNVGEDVAGSVELGGTGE